jgi:hypothetical protein
MNYQSIGKEKAIELAKTEWWKDKTPREIAKFQHFTEELCCPFTVFHEALEKTLGRPVWTHEMALNRDGIGLEILGESDVPSMQEIMELIPAEKRVLIQL